MLLSTHQPNPFNRHTLDGFGWCVDSNCVYPGARIYMHRVCVAVMLVVGVIMVAVLAGAVACPAGMLTPARSAILLAVLSALAAVAVVAYTRTHGETHKRHGKSHKSHDKKHDKSHDKSHDKGSSSPGAERGATPADQRRSKLSRKLSKLSKRSETPVGKLNRKLKLKRKRSGTPASKFSSKLNNLNKRSETPANKLSSKLSNLNKRSATPAGKFSNKLNNLNKRSVTPAGKLNTFSKRSETPAGKLSTFSATPAGTLGSKHRPGLIAYVRIPRSAWSPPTSTHTNYKTHTRHTVRGGTLEWHLSRHRKDSAYVGNAMDTNTADALHRYIPNGSLVYGQMDANACDCTGVHAVTCAIVASRQHIWITADGNIATYTRADYQGNDIIYNYIYWLCHFPDRLFIISRLQLGINQSSVCYHIDRLIRAVLICRYFRPDRDQYIRTMRMYTHAAMGYEDYYISDAAFVTLYKQCKHAVRTRLGYIPRPPNMCREFLMYLLTHDNHYIEGWSLYAQCTNPCAARGLAISLYNQRATPAQYGVIGHRAFNDTIFTSLREYLMKWRCMRQYLKRLLRHMRDPAEVAPPPPAAPAPAPAAAAAAAVPQPPAFDGNGDFLIAMEYAEYQYAVEYSVNRCFTRCHILLDLLQGLIELQPPPIVLAPTSTIKSLAYMFNSIVPPNIIPDTVPRMLNQIKNYNADNVPVSAHRPTRANFHPPLSQNDIAMFTRFVDEAYRLREICRHISLYAGRPDQFIRDITTLSDCAMVQMNLNGVAYWFENHIRIIISYHRNHYGWMYSSGPDAVTVESAYIAAVNIIYYPDNTLQ